MKCSYCKREDPTCGFKASVLAGSGPRKCRDCDRDQRRLLRAAAVDKLGGACAYCGDPRRALLDVDHIDSCGESRESSARMYRNILNGASGYQLLCPTCHRIKTRIQEEGSTSARLCPKCRTAAEETA